jgi:hypothetical protein
MQSYLHIDEEINELEWRKMKPEKVFDQLEYHINKSPKKLSF